MDNPILSKLKIKPTPKVVDDNSIIIKFEKKKNLERKKK